jgi:LPS export ABC transporter protein LptC
MSNAPEKTAKGYRARAGLPRVLRYVALAVMAVTVFAVGVGFYRERANAGFKLKSEHTQLSTDVIAEVRGYERLETDGSLPKYYVKADFARTFSDNHQELENAYVRIYDDAGNPADELSAQQALYIPEADKRFTAYMKGDVRIASRDGLKVRTDNIVYTKATEIAEAEGPVEFERENVRGRSTGAVVRLGERTLELLSQVEIETFESPELAASGIRYAKVNASNAVYKHNEERIDLAGSVAVNIQSKSAGIAKNSDIRSERASLLFNRAEESVNQADVTAGTQLRKLELFDNVNIVSTDEGKPPTTINAGYALYDKVSDFFELKNAVHIVTSANDKSTDVRSSYASYSDTALKMNLSGGAEILQGGESVKGDAIDAELFPDKKVRFAKAHGNAFVRQSNAERTTSISAPEVSASWGESRSLVSAKTVGNSTVRLEPRPLRANEYSLVTVSAPNAVNAAFRGDGLLERVDTDGRTTIQMNGAGNAQNAANKRVTADKVTTVFHQNGKDLRRAEAVGNGELFIEPLTAAPENYRTTVYAPRFDCDFYDAGNNAKACVAGKKTRTLRQPTVQSAGRGDQSLLADQLTATFSQTSGDVEQLEGRGSAKFTELARNATAAQMVYTRSDETVRLRGGTPTAWDGASRAKAQEIDWDTRNKKSFLRGSVSTTYYSAGSANGATPFAKSEKPVFVTSESAEVDHNAQTMLFLGNARAWQDDNFVRGDRLHVSQNDGQFDAVGNVQSALYDAKQKGNSAGTPVFASSKAMRYNRNARLLQYRENVDIRQGTDRITSGMADVFLDENNEVVKTVAENSVVLTQPHRRGTGDWVQYTAADEVAVLRGRPAVVSDAERGSSQSNEITVYMRENRFVGTGGTAKAGTGGRSKSVYKVKGKP